VRSDPDAEESPVPARRTGRPRGASDLREGILGAAQRQFSEDGFANTSVRSVAREAGVDPGLVRHYFGSKEGLLREAVILPVDPVALIADVLAEGPESAGRDTVTRGILTPLAEALDVDQPQLRAALVASQIVGFALAARVVALGPLQGLTPEDVARALGPTLQRYLTGSLD